MDSNSNPNPESLLLLMGQPDSSPLRPTSPSRGCGCGQSQGHQGAPMYECFHMDEFMTQNSPILINDTDSDITQDGNRSPARISDDDSDITINEVASNNSPEADQLLVREDGDRDEPDQHEDHHHQIRNIPNLSTSTFNFHETDSEMTEEDNRNNIEFDFEDGQHIPSTNSEEERLQQTPENDQDSHHTVCEEVILPDHTTAIKNNLDEALKMVTHMSIELAQVKAQLKAAQGGRTMMDSSTQTILSGSELPSIRH